MRHSTHAVIGSTTAITRCTCGWTSRKYDRKDVALARQDAADHIITEQQLRLDLPSGAKPAKS